MRASVREWEDNVLHWIYVGRLNRLAHEASARSRCSLSSLKLTVVFPVLTCPGGAEAAATAAAATAPAAAAAKDEAHRNERAG